MNLPTKQYENIAFSAEFVASMLDGEGNSKAAQLVRSLAEQRAELLEAAKAALKEAEAWIKDQLGGTSSYQQAMDDLQLIRSAITRAEATE